MKIFKTMAMLMALVSGLPASVFAENKKEIIEIDVHMKSGTRPPDNLKFLYRDGQYLEKGFILKFEMWIGVMYTPAVMPFKIVSNISGKVSCLSGPSVGLGNAVDNYSVMLYPGGDKSLGQTDDPCGDMEAWFWDSTKNGGFDIPSEFERVHVMARSSKSTGFNAVLIERRPGWPFPTALLTN